MNSGLYKKIQDCLTLKQKIQFFIFILFGFLKNLLELFSISLFLPIFLSITNFRNENIFNNPLLNKFFIFFTKMNLELLVIILGLSFLFTNIFKIFIEKFLLDLQRRFRVNLSGNLLLLSIKENFNVQKKTSDVLNDVWNEIKNFWELVISFYEMIINTLFILIIFISLFLIDKNLTVIFLLISVFFTFLIFLFSKNFLFNLGKKRIELNQISIGNVIEFYKFKDQIKVSQNFDLFINTFKYNFNKFRKTFNFIKLSKVIISNLIEIIISILLVIYILYSINKGVDTIEFTAKIGTIFLLLSRFISKINLLNINYQNFTTKISSLNLIYDQLKEIKTQKLNLINPEIVKDKSSKKLNTIELKNISLSYDSLNVFKNLNIKIDHKDPILISGNVGSGKTSLIRLILGLLTNFKGNVFYNNDTNLNTKNIINKYGRIGLVSQENLILNTSILQNIILSIDNKLYDKNKLEKILEITESKIFINELPNKIDSLIGEGGVDLSGGQKQKIAICRALYNGDQIFIFDEATSNLDQNTAKMIVKNICNFLNDKITIFISHQKDHFDEKIKIISL
tara:strand:+ start:66 stop:1769 length:1704 start_codon:yes stop_codon:yes gene_type:complete